MSPSPQTYIVDLGPKPLARGKAVASTVNPIVTETVLAVLAAGGNAADAAIAGSLVQAAVEPHLTSHAGMVSFLYWDAGTATAQSDVDRRYAGRPVLCVVGHDRGRQPRRPAGPRLSVKRAYAGLSGGRGRSCAPVAVG